MSGGQIIRVNDITGGEASAFPPGAMPQKFSCLLQNGQVSERGGIGSIPGYVRVNQSPCGVKLKSGFEFVKSDGTKILLAAGGGKIFKFSHETAWTEIHSGLDNNAIVSFASMNNICIMVNGVDAPQKYNGTAVSALGGSPPATAFKVHVHCGRVWMLERANAMLATHSALNNPEDYTTAANAGYIDFKFVFRRGAKLVDVQTFVDVQVFFFSDSIVIYSGSDPTASGDYKIEQLIDGTGLIGTGAVIPLGTDLAFLSSNGMKTLRQVVTTGSLSVGSISQAIDSDIRKDAAEAQNFSFAHYQRRGWAIMQIGQSMRIYSYGYNAWSRVVGADCQGIFHASDGRVYICGTGYLYEYGHGSLFDRVAPQFAWETAWLSLGQGKRAFPKVIDFSAFPSEEILIELRLMYDLQEPVTDEVIALRVSPYNMTFIDKVTDFDAISPFDETIFAQIRAPLYGGGQLLKMRFSAMSKSDIEISGIAVQTVKGKF